MFHIIVAKVDLDVTYVAIAIHACCKGVLQMFHLFVFSEASCKCVYFECCICCKCFYLDVAYICIGFSSVFRCFCKCFRCILQVFQLVRTHVASVSSGCCKSRSGVAHVAMEPTCCRACMWEAKGDGGRELFPLLRVEPDNFTI